jgi:hypothetical protein
MASAVRRFIEEFRGGEADRCFKRRFADLNDLLARGEKLDVDALQEVEALSRMIELQSRVRGRSHTWVVVGVGVLALVPGFWLLRPVTTVRVEATVRATSIRVVNPNVRTLAIDYPLRSFRASGFTRVRGIDVARGQPSPGSISAAPLLGGTMTLQQLTIPEGAILVIARDRGGRVSIEIQSPHGGGVARVSRRGPNSVVVGNDTTEFASANHRPIVVDFPSGQFGVTFVPGDPGLHLMNDLGADSISFDEVRRPTEGEWSGVDLSSTITSGELLLTAVPSRATELRSRERLHLHAKSVQIHSIRLEPESLIVEFRARATKLATGPEDELRDLRPTKLEMLAVNRPLNLAWTFYASAVVLLVAIFGRIRRA